MRTEGDIGQKLPASSTQGLTSAAVVQSRQLFGANRLTALPREPIWRKFLEKFDEPIIRILLAAAFLSMVVDLSKAEPLFGGLGLGLLAVLVSGACLCSQARLIPILLFGTALLLFIAGAAAGHFLVEGFAVMLAVILATGVAFASEYKSDREFELLNARKESLQAKVLRDDQVHTIDIEDVVVGDIVLLEMGDEIPADGRVLKAAELYVDQSLMTGESEPVRKHVKPTTPTKPQGEVLRTLGVRGQASGPEEPGCLYRGTQVVDGAGQMFVTEVGDETYLGQIARRLSIGDDDEQGDKADAEHQRIQHKLTIDKNLTPLQLKLKHLAQTISKVGYLAAILIFFAQLIRGVVVGEIFVPRTGAETVDVFGELIGYFVTMVIIIVVAVPEGLPMSVTVSLALAMRKMTRANSLVRQLVACETIGSATVICTDKTGTLTQNKMRVELVSFGLEEPAGVTGLKVRNMEDLFGRLSLNAALNSTANLEVKDGALVTVGNSTEGALLQWLGEGGVDHLQLRRSCEVLFQVHFSSERKRMTSVVRQGPRLFVLVKGAPEWVLEHCSLWHAPLEGRQEAFTPEARQRVRQHIDSAARQAMRTLAFAYAELPPDHPSDEASLQALCDSLESHLIYIGFVAIRDALRGDVKDAIAQCHRAGIAVKMVTGDNVETARAIGYEIGLVDSPNAAIDTLGAAVLTSPHFNELTDDELKQQLPGLRILARARPLDKFRLVRLLQELGEVVAVTGDGTNDAPALKKADVGLAMGITGTEVAKEASKIVLLDGAFSTIVWAVQWGRSLYENIQRFIQFQLTINVSALTITFLGILLFNVQAPFTVLQLLWINVIMDTLASIALCSEPPRPEVMLDPPKRRDENILTQAMRRNIFLTGAFFVVVMLCLLFYIKGDPRYPGFLAGADSGEDGTWLVEVAGTRFAVEGRNLEPVFSMNLGRTVTSLGRTRSLEQWRIRDDYVDPELRGREVSVDFTVHQVSLFFSIFVFFQVWNQINCRSLRPDLSGLYRLGQNRIFLAVAATVAVGQVLIITFGGNVFKVEPLSLAAWSGIIAFTATSLVFAEIIRRISWKEDSARKA
jgi:P-type Ca2+ transporter type 2C